MKYQPWNGWHELLLYYLWIVQKHIQPSLWKTWSKYYVWYWSESLGAGSKIQSWYILPAKRNSIQLRMTRGVSCLLSCSLLYSDSCMLQSMEKMMHTEFHTDRPFGFIIIFIFMVKLSVLFIYLLFFIILFRIALNRFNVFY